MVFIYCELLINSFEGCSHFFIRNIVYIFHSLFQKQALFEIKWVNLEESENTWEPLKNLTGCEGKLVEFYTKRKVKYETAPASR